MKTLPVLRQIYGRRGGLSKSTDRRLMAKFETSGFVNNKLTPVRRRSSKSAENIPAVRGSEQEDVSTMGILQPCTVRLNIDTLDIENNHEPNQYFFQTPTHFVNLLLTQ